MSAGWILAKVALGVMLLVVLAAVAWVLFLVWVLKVESYGNEPEDIDAPDEPVVDPDEWDDDPGSPEDYGDGGGSPRP